MTSRQRVQSVLNNSTPDRIPFNFWMDRNLMAEYEARLGYDFRITHYGADVLETFFCYDFHCGLRGEHIRDHKTSWQTTPALPRMEDARKMNFPAVAGNEDAITTLISRDRDRLPDIALFAMLGSPLDQFFSLRMMENAMTDIYEYPDEVGFIIGNYSAILTDIVKCLSCCDIDVLYLAGDVCATRGPMLSNDMLRRLMTDPMKPAVDTAHALGIKVFYHTCGGNVAPVLPLLVECGFDGINPLQPHLNDSAAFKRDYGGKLMLYGGLDNCFAIPDSTPDGVRRHVREQFAALGPDGLIFSTHDIPDHVPPANIDAMVDEIKNVRNSL